MKLTRNVAVAASALIITGISGIGSTAVHAATQHCEGKDFKVELDGASTTVDTGLSEGTEVCIKAGNRVTTVFVDSDGNITNDFLRNRNGKPQGISYYAWSGGTTSS